MRSFFIRVLANETARVSLQPVSSNFTIFINDFDPVHLSRLVFDPKPMVRSVKHPQVSKQAEGLLLAQTR